MISAYKNKIKHALGVNPFLFSCVFRLFGGKNKWLMFDANTEIVIEGFPRSANTFSVTYFLITQPKAVSVAHHLHVEAQLIWAAKNDIPGVVLIRDPEDCVRSLCVREKRTSVKRALTRYIKYYTNLMPYKDSLVVAEFSLVISDMEKVINSVNAKYGVSFEACPHTNELVAKIYNEIESINSRLDGGKSTHVARPNNYRKEMISQIDFVGNEELLLAAKRTYAGFINGC